MKIATFIATCAGIGRLPRMPGTYGALLALPLAWALMLVSVNVFIIASSIVLTIGTWAAHVHANESKSQDPQEVIIDEVAGQFIALWAVAFGFVSGWLGFIIAFILFRAFDICKPFPINYLDKHVKGGIGIMLDDVVAGLFVLMILYSLQNWL